MTLTIHCGERSIIVDCECRATVKPIRFQWTITTAGDFGSQGNWPGIRSSKWPDYKAVVGRGETLDIALAQYMIELVKVTGAGLETNMLTAGLWNQDGRQGTPG